jgi:hypothetical protein
MLHHMPYSRAHQTASDALAISLQTSLAQHCVAPSIDFGAHDAIAELN